MRGALKIIAGLLECARLFLFVVEYLNFGMSGRIQESKYFFVHLLTVPKQDMS